MIENLADLQPKILEDFQKILAEDRLSHAYLFSGEFGSFEMALYLAQSRFCDDLSPTNLPCGQCRSCRLVISGELADMTVLEPLGQLIKTEQVRELTRDFARSSYEGTSQVFIIKEADKMHINAANSLLKQIEEPHSKTYIILLTSDDNKVLPTIKSRCQIFRFVTNRAYLQSQLEEAGLLKSQARVLSQLTDDPGRLIELVNNKKLLEMTRLTESFVEVLERDPDSAYLQVARLVALATDKIEQDLCLQMVLVQASQPKIQLKRSAMFQKIHTIRSMWQANVSFQNVLDYLVLTL